MRTPTLETRRLILRPFQKEVQSSSYSSRFTMNPAITISLEIKSSQS